MQSAQCTPFIALGDACTVASSAAIASAAHTSPAAAVAATSSSKRANLKIIDSVSYSRRINSTSSNPVQILCAHDCLYSDTYYYVKSSYKYCMYEDLTLLVDLAAYNAAKSRYDLRRSIYERLSCVLSNNLLTTSTCLPTQLP